MPENQGFDGPNPSGSESNGPKPFDKEFPDLDPRAVTELMGLPLFSAHTAAMNLHSILGRMMHAGGNTDTSDVQAAIGEAGRVYSAVSAQFDRLGYTAEEVRAGDKVQRGEVLLPPLSPLDPIDPE